MTEEISAATCELGLASVVVLVRSNVLVGSIALVGRLVLVCTIVPAGITVFVPITLVGVEGRVAAFGNGWVSDDGFGTDGPYDL